MGATLYGITLSHPVVATRLALEHKGAEHRLVNLPAGMHPPLIKALGFDSATVPALRIDDARVQGSTEITDYLEANHRGPSLYEASGRHSVERIRKEELWAERVLQPLPRRIFRWAATENYEVRRWMARVDRLPLTGAVATVSKPVAYLLGRQVGVSDERIEADLRALPAVLERVEELLDEGVIGTDQRNAADYQIAASVRSLHSFSDLRELVGRSPAAEHARAIVPEPPGPVPPALRSDWIPSS